LSAVLLGLMVAPAYRNRAVRLTTQRLKERLPLSEDEVRADKDRLRASYAIKVHKLEMKVDQSKLEKARQTIEIHRRDGQISLLEQERSRLTALVDENMNARHVLEQTVADRLPKVEARLNEAKSILFNRDREIADLTQSTKRQREALEEANSINSQQGAELERLTNALTVRGARNQQSLADPSFEGELALRAEIEALRSKTREQASLIGRLQGHVGRGALAALPAGSEGRPALNGSALNGSGLNGSGVHGSGIHGSGIHGSGVNGQASNGHDSALAEPSVDHGRAALAVVATSDEHRAEHEREIRQLRGKIDDQASDIARLSAELATLSGGDTGAGLKDSKIALKARLNAAQAQAEQNAETVKRLRAELAAANERLALQGAHFMEQMRRLGAGTLPAAGQTRRPVTSAQKLTLAERVAMGGTRPPAAEVRPTAPGATVVPLPSSNEVADTDDDIFADATASEPPAASDAPRKPRLIDRISNLNKT
jgi:hypothetical protein